LIKYFPKSSYLIIFPANGHTFWGKFLPIFIGANVRQILVILSGVHFASFVIIIIVPAFVFPFSGVRWWHEIGHLDTVFQVILRYGIRSSRNFNYWAVIEIIAKQCRINGGRHQNYPQIRICVNHITKNNHDKIWTDISFVDFIYDDMRHTPNRKRKFKYYKYKGCKNFVKLI